MVGVHWRPDILGEGFEAADVPVPLPDAPQRRATLVRFRDAGAPVPATGQAVLYLHGWSDYFFNAELARFFTGLGVHFYALDLHNHGRSLREGAVGGYVRRLADYDDEVRLARRMVAENVAADGADDVAVAIMGHSTGGLIAALWAARNPGLVSHLILNSPWLETHGGALVRRSVRPIVHPLARLIPERRMRVPARTFYWRTISDQAQGEWRLDPRLRPPGSFPIRMGWLDGILEGQAQVARGLALPVPVLVLLSTRSLNGPVWREDMARADVVLDVNALAHRALSLGPRVSVERISGALHDVLLSPRPVRNDAYARLRQWIRGYMGLPTG